MYKSKIFGTDVKLRRRRDMMEGRLIDEDRSIRMTVFYILALVNEEGII